MKAELKLALCGLGLALLEQEKRSRRQKVRRNRTKWVNPWNQQRQSLGGAYPNVCRKLEMDEPDDFRNFARLFPAQFRMLEELVTPIIRRQNTNYRDCISVGERLTVTLHFLATGESFNRLSYLFRMGVSTIGKFVPETCQAIYRVLRETYLKCPDQTNEWQQVALGFKTQWNFPNCIGALDGKHIKMRLPPGTGLPYPNHPFSIVLMALVDSKYKFLYVDVGCNGKISDGRVFGGCTFADALESRTVNIPGPAPLPGSDQQAPHCIVADEAFPLKDYLMTPFANCVTLEQQVFNNRLLQARSVAQNAFGILANRFHVLQTNLTFQDTAKVEDTVLACCALHNFLCVESGEKYMADIVDKEGPNMTMVPGRWRQAALPQTNTTTRAKQTRDELCGYFMSNAFSV